MHREFEPGLAALKGKVLADVTMMAVKTAKTTEETRSLVAELKERVKRAEEITGEKIAGIFAKAIMISFLDPMTKQQNSV